MRLNSIIGLLLALLLTIFTGCGRDLDRVDLIALMDQYLAAIAQHDPSGLQLASNAKFVENTQAIPIGRGLWETATGGPTNFRIYIADPVAGQIGFLGVIEENTYPTILGARLKVVNGETAESKHVRSSGWSARTGQSFGESPA